MKKVFDISEITEKDVKPKKKGEVSFYIDKKWYKCVFKEQFQKITHPLKSLDVQLLQDYVLEPIFGITDPRTSKQIDFVGGIRGIQELERRCEIDAKCAFAMYPVSVDEVMKVADNKMIMPPKSTWFEPKPFSGCVIRVMSKQE